MNDVSGEQFYIAERRPVLQYPDRRLAQLSTSCVIGDAATDQAIADLVLAYTKLDQLLLAKDGKHSAFCMSAPQIGHNLRAFVARDESTADGYRIFVNPVITSASGEQLVPEHCTSFPHGALTIKRPETVVVETLDHLSRLWTIRAEGVAASLICHNIDHLDGKMIIDRVSASRRSRALRHHEKKQSHSVIKPLSRDVLHAEHS